MDIKTLQEGNGVYFNTFFSALLALFSVQKRACVITANQSVSVAQALSYSAVEHRFCDIGLNGLAEKGVSEEELFIATDYAGVMEPQSDEVAIWYNGAGYLEKEIAGRVTLIDLTTLNPSAEAAGALVLCEDEQLLTELKRFASLGIEKGAVWNDRVRSQGIDGLMSPLAYAYWQESLPQCIEATKRTAEVTALYAERLGKIKLLETLETHFPRFYPLRLVPELFCPKEDIFEALQDSGVAVSVPYKPLYRYDAFKGEFLRGNEYFYKAVIALPVHGVTPGEAEQIAGAFEQVIGQYAYRGCSF